MPHLGGFRPVSKGFEEERRPVLERFWGKEAKRAEQDCPQTPAPGALKLLKVVKAVDSGE